MPTGSARDGWGATARQALLYALPLGLVALLAAQWLDADYLALREEARRQAQAMAGDLGAAASARVAEIAGEARTSVARALGDARNPPVELWRVISFYDQQLLVLIREGEQTLFPPEDPLAMPKMWEEKLRTLIGVASLLREGDLVNGWFPDASGAYFFECRRNGERAERKETCIALNSRFIFPEIAAALDARAGSFSGWTLRLRDPFDRVIWQKNHAGADYESFLQSGVLHGWAVDVAGAAPPRHGALGRLALAAPLALVWLLLVVQARRADKERLAEAAARAALAARLSHDLRTPLANLKLYTELIARKAEGAPGLERYCAVLGEEVDRLDLLAGETIFDAAPPPAPRTQRAENPCALAQKIVARYERLLAASGSSCEVACATQQALRFDVGAFERILVNLLDNARKYAPGRILVSLDWRDGWLTLSVRDFGGAGPQSSHESPVLASHGLGLAIVRELTRARGGGFSLSGADPGLRATASMRASASGSNRDENERGENPDR